MSCSQDQCLRAMLQPHNRYSQAELEKLLDFHELLLNENGYAYQAANGDEVLEASWPLPSESDPEVKAAVVSLQDGPVRLGSQPVTVGNYNQVKFLHGLLTMDYQNKHYLLTHTIQRMEV